VHDPQLGNGPREDARTHGPEVGCAPAVRSSRSNKDARCVSRARPPTCSIAKLHSGRTQNPGRRPLDCVGRFYAEPFERPKTARATLAINHESPRSSEERAGTSATAVAGQRVATLASATQKHATRPANAEGKRASTSGVPAIPPHHDPLGIVTRDKDAGPAMQVRSQSFAKNRDPHELERPQPRIARQTFTVLMLNSGSEIWVNASASTVRSQNRRHQREETGGQRDLSQQEPAAPNAFSPRTTQGMQSIK
jgi:hypothetical protein